MTHDELEQSHREQHFEGLSDDLHANRRDGREKPQLRLLGPQIRRHPLQAHAHRLLLQHSLWHLLRAARASWKSHGILSRSSSAYVDHE